MHYAIFCYNDENLVSAWSPPQRAAVMARLGDVQAKLRAENRLGPVARLLPTTAAVTLRKGRDDLVLDGPFAETREQLLGFYVVDCDSLEQAVAIARELLHANEGAGGYEIRPLRAFRPGTLAELPA
jgi:hypothetical protein